MPQLKTKKYKVLQKMKRVDACNYGMVVTEWHGKNVFQPL